MPKIWGYLIAKRMMDIIGALFGILIFLPLFLCVAIWIKLSDYGPVFYRDVRLGKNGRKIRIFKFRTMVDGAENCGGPLTASDDFRITRYGRILREYKIDELPQLLNVLCGEMSLVGPRAQKPFFYQFYNHNEKKMIFSVRPGITDLASLVFHNEEKILSGNSDVIEVYSNKIAKEKIKLQLEYIKQRNFFLDLWLIFATVICIFSTRVFDNSVKTKLTGWPIPDKR